MTVSGLIKFDFQAIIFLSQFGPVAEPQQKGVSFQRFMITHSTKIISKQELGASFFWLCIVYSAIILWRDQNSESFLPGIEISLPNIIQV